MNAERRLVRVHAIADTLGRGRHRVAAIVFFLDVEPEQPLLLNVDEQDRSLVGERRVAVQLGRDFPTELLPVH